MRRYRTEYTKRITRDYVLLQTFSGKLIRWVLPVEVNTRKKRNRRKIMGKKSRRKSVPWTFNPQPPARTPEMPASAVETVETSPGARQWRGAPEEIACRRCRHGIWQTHCSGPDPSAAGAPANRAEVFLVEHVYCCVLGEWTWVNDPVMGYPVACSVYEPEDQGGQEGDPEKGEGADAPGEPGPAEQEGEAEKRH